MGLFKQFLTRGIPNLMTGGIPLMAQGYEYLKSGGAEDLWDKFVKGPTDALSGVTAAETAAEAQQKAMEMSIAEQRRQFDMMQGLLNPYVEAGTGAIQQQQALAGALGPEAQQAAIDSIQMSPGYQAALQQGEQSILSNAAATGGLRGGNTQAALAQFSPQLLSQAIDQRYGQLGGLAGLGQASAAGVGAAGMGSGIAGSLADMGQQQAANILGQYNLQSSFLKDLAGLGIQLMGAF